MVVFRIEVDAFPDLQQSIYIETELMFSESIHLNKAKTADSLKTDPSLPAPNDQVEFKKVSRSVNRINNIFVPINEYFPAIFDEYHFAICDLTLHTFLIDFKYSIDTPELEGRRHRRQNSCPDNQTFKTFLKKVTDDFAP